MISLPFIKTLDTITDRLMHNAVDAAKDAAVNGILAGGKNSLVEFSAVTRVEPIVLIDQRVEHLDFMTDVMQSLNSIFAGYYLQAAALMVTLNKIEVIKQLDRLNPNRDPWQLAVAKESLLQEDSYQTQLPYIGRAVGMENYGVESAISDAAKEIKDAANLSVGKLVEVTVAGNGDKDYKIPINIRLIASTIDTALLTHILVSGSRDLSLTERIHQLRSGEIEMIRDFIFCQDLIDEHRQMLIKDSKGQFAEILRRRRNNGLATVTNGKTSMATASNIIVISDDTRKEIERSQGIKFSNAKSREAMFDKTYVMLLAVVDADHQYVTIYTRGIALPTEMTVRQLKSANKGSGPDITEILRAYQLGNSYAA